MKLYKRILFFLFLLLLEVLLIAQERQSIYNGELVRPIEMQNSAITLLLQLPNFATTRSVEIPAGDSTFAMNAFGSDGFSVGSMIRFAVAQGSDTTVFRPLGQPLLFNGTTLPMPPPLIHVRLIKNQAPQITSEPIMVTQVSSSYRYQINAIDPESDRLHYKLVTAPPWLTVDTLGVVTGVPSDTGKFSVELEVSDDYKGVVKQQFLLQSYPPNSIEPDISAQTFTVYQNYPNPFNPSTTIMFELNKRAEVSLVIFTSLGEVIASKFFGELPEGVYDELITQLNSSGVYYYRFNVHSEDGAFYTETKTMMFIK